MRTLVLSLAIGWLLANMAIAGETCKPPAACGEVQTCGNSGCCAHCGCCCPCEKHCCVVCEMKEVKKTCWVVKCEDFCPLLPGCRRDCCESGDGGEACNAEAGCSNECGGKKCNPCACEENKCFVPPKCGKMREKKVLEKKEVVCKVPSYKCVVVYCCPHCGQSQQCDGQQAPLPEPAPVKPATPAPAPAPMRTK